MTMKSNLALQRDPIPSTGNRAVRAGLDVVRMSKFLASGKGLEFLAKQQGLQLTNPNMESVNGVVDVKANLKLYQTKIFSPAKFLQNIAGDGIFPRHTERHGLTSDQTFLKYEHLLKIQREDKTNQNRLVKLHNDLLENQRLTFVGQAIDILSGPTGPSTILGAGGAGRTYIFRSVDSRSGLSYLTAGKDGRSGTRVEPLIYSRETKPKSKLEEKYETNLNSPEVPNGVFAAKPVDINTQRYFALSYGQIAKKANDRTLSTTDINNFGVDIAKTDTLTTAQQTEFKSLYPLGAVIGTTGEGGKFTPGVVTSANATNYLEINLEKLYGYTSYRNLDRSNTTNGAAPDKFMRGEHDRDIISFSIGGIKFRAYIDSISDNFSPQWNEANDQGRADPKVMLGSFTRTISVSFKVVATSRADLGSVYDKLKSLARLTMPKYLGNGFTGDFVQLTIGNLYRNEYGYITGLSYDWDNESPWEIDEGIELPLYTNVTLDFTYIGNTRMSNKHNVFNYNYGKRKLPVATGITEEPGVEDPTDIAFKDETGETGKAS